MELPLLNQKTTSAKTNPIIAGFIFTLFFGIISGKAYSQDYPSDFSGPKYHFDKIATPSAPDYSQPENWMFLPDDTSRFDVDLIWINPTTFVSDSLWNMPMSNKASKSGAKRDFESMAGIFNESCNIYSPYYRQACLAILSADKSDYTAAKKLANTDVARAVEYYFAHYNNGRKFVIAGHSQGAYHILELLKNNQVLKEHLPQMVAAYVVGWSVTSDDTLAYPQLNMCDSASETGCIISYNTIEDGFQEEAANLTLFPNSISVNPLIWKTTDEYAPKELHEGAIFPTKNGIDTIYHYTSAQNKGGLCVDRPVNVDDFVVYKPYFHPGIYHVYDYEFFHLNLKDNLKTRIEAYNRKNKN
jgi:hypothetical protein